MVVPAAAEPHARPLHAGRGLGEGCVLMGAAYRAVSESARLSVACEGTAIALDRPAVAGKEEGWEAAIPGRRSV